jgi:hypothetical protein
LLIHSNYRAKRQADPGRTPKASTPAVIVHPVLGLDVPNDRLDRGAAAHLGAVTRRTWPLIQTRNFSA